MEKFPIQVTGRWTVIKYIKCSNAGLLKIRRILMEMGNQERFLFRGRVNGKFSYSGVGRWNGQ
jgi:hypothetical protein